MTDRPVAVVYGELLMRLDPPGFQRLVQADSFEVRFTGAEANAGVSLVNFGVPTRVISRVPDTEIGEACVRFMRRHGLDTTFVARGGERLGLFYLETGVAQRPSKVIYDRSGTSFRTAEATDYDWPSIFAGATWFHFSGTAAALGPRAEAALDDALTAAAGAGVTVSCDLNYRKMLWADRSPAAVMEPLMDRVHVLIGNEEDTERVFGIRAGASDPSAGRLDADSYMRAAAELVRRFGFRTVATTLRGSRSASTNSWAAIVSNGTTAWASRTYDINPIVDRVGAGDAFSGALIYGLLSGWDEQAIVEFATAASCLKHGIPGDFNQVTVAEVNALVAGDASGRVQR
jgi:2-dehydro-3-deoxygluconokinase